MWRPKVKSKKMRISFYFDILSSCTTGDHLKNGICGNANLLFTFSNLPFFRFSVMGFRPRAGSFRVRLEYSVFDEIKLFEDYEYIKLYIYLNNFFKYVNAIKNNHTYLCKSSSKKFMLNTYWITQNISENITNFFNLWF